MNGLKLNCDESAIAANVFRTELSNNPTYHPRSYKLFTDVRRIAAATKRFEDNCLMPGMMKKVTFKNHYGLKIFN